MLGWEVYVRQESEQVNSIAAWEANPGLLTTMEQLVERGDAIVVEMHGGYPNIYKVRVGMITDWCLDDPPEMCKKWGGTGYANWTALDALHEKDWVYLEMWDGS